ncbi:uncharacterized protein LOC129725799 [Wyeomyia smithii]|uniref:uncharacterized protein LOC129725799 n=1 Tax=Wyeomyia smithii TaxID=174621 RepID=UPI002467C993|nr:uncharacterized protein LOC129725799 [Wyeomyia smithii]
MQNSDHLTRMYRVFRIAVLLLITMTVFDTNGSVTNQNNQLYQIIFVEESNEKLGTSSNATSAFAKLDVPESSTVYYLVATESIHDEKTTHKSSLRESSAVTPTMDVITVIWYGATLIALISFFVVMACADTSKCFSAKPPDVETAVPPTPAPSYRLFAPPSYESVIQKTSSSIFIIPIDTGGNDQTSIHSTEHLVNNHGDVENQVTVSSERTNT